MSRQLINEYRAEHDWLRAVSGSRRERVRRRASKDPLKRQAAPAIGSSSPSTPC